MANSIDYQDAAWFLLRRMHQLAVALFMEAAEGSDLTPVQFSVLMALTEWPGEDQVSLSRRIALDPATSGSVIARLEAKTWIRREPDADDRRRKRLWITPEGTRVARSMQDKVALTQASLLAPLTEPERAAFVELLSKTIRGHDGFSFPPA